MKSLLILSLKLVMLKARLLRTQGHFLHMQTNCPLSATRLEPATIFL